MITVAKPNVTIVGNLTNNNGILSGFSSSNYAKLPSAANVGSSPFEIVIKFTPTNNATTLDLYRSHFDGNGNPFLDLEYDSGKVGVWGGNGTTWFQENIVGTTTLTLGIPYWVKVTQNNNNYSLYLSTDGENYQLEKTGTLSIPFDSSSIATIGYPYQTNNTVDLNGCYIKIGGELVWTGIVFENYYNLTVDTSPSDASVSLNPSRVVVQSNITTVGSLTSNNGVYSGFTRYKYIKPPYMTSGTTALGNNVEINLCVNMDFAPPSSSTDMSIFCQGSNSATIFVRSGDYSIRVYTGSAENVILPAGLAAAGDRVYIKIKMLSGYDIIESISALVGNDYIIDNLPPLSSGLWSTYTGAVANLIGSNNRICGGYSQTSKNYLGSFDCTNSNITVDGVEYIRFCPTGYLEDTEVTYQVSKSGYISKSGTVIMDNDKNISVALIKPFDMFLGGENIQQIYIGTQEVSNIYLGDNLVYGTNS